MCCAFQVRLAVAAVLLARSSLSAAQEILGITLEAACQQIHANGKAELCKTPVQIQAVSPWAPIVYDATYQQAKDPVDAHLYPSTFAIRDAWPSDNLDNLEVLPKCQHASEDGYLILERAPKETTIQQNSVKVATLADHVIPASHYTDNNVTSVQRVDPAYNYIAEGAHRFQEWVKEGLVKATGMEVLQGLEGAAFDLEWGTRRASQPCNDIAKEYFQKISTQLEEIPQDTHHRERANLLLRLVTVHWGEPQVVANLLTLFGCNTEESYDEFLSCTTVLADMLVDFNVFQRNVDTTGDPWECETCSLHNHKRWYASRIIAGSINYTMFRPDCPHSLDTKKMPTDTELDKDVASSPNGTLLDQLGTRFAITEDKQAVWETTEIVQLQAGDTVVFSPSWYHRIPPPSKDAAYSAMSMVLKYEPMPTYDGALIVDPYGIDDFDTDKAACYKLIDLYRALSNPNLDIQKGLFRFPCDPQKLHDVKENDFSNGTDVVEDGVLHYDEL